MLAAVFLDLVGFGMVFPDIQTRAERFLPGVASPGVWIGLLLAASFAVQLLASPRWGRLSDSVGRRPVLVGCQLLSAFALLVYGSAESYGLLLVSRVLSGLGAANVAVAQAYVADLAGGAGGDAAERTGGMGRVSAAISAGLVMGPAAGGFLAHAGGNRLIGIVGASLSGIGGLAAYLTMRRTGPRPPESSSERWGARRRAALDLSLLGRYPAIRPLVLVSVVASFALATLEGTFGRLIKRMLGFGEIEFGIVFSYESLLGVLMGAVLLGFVAMRLPQTRLLRVAFVLQGVGLALNPLAGPLAPWVPGMATLLFASTLYALGAGAANPTIAAAVSAEVPERHQGELFGVLQIARNFGFVVGPILGGRLFDLAPAAPYLFAGLVSLAAAGFVPRLARTVS